MLSAFQKQLSTIDQASAGKEFLLAVSGGLDSVVMAALFNLAGYKYSIAHCNFKLRGKESNGDEKFVKELASKYGVPFFSVSFDTNKFCTENKISVQMGARQLRYRWLEEIREKNKIDYIVTAHHADDAIETFFINLLRGTGISGLHGIKAMHENTIRPMLNFYRKEIEIFAKKNKLKWREDSSNETDKYERNKIRHHLLPALEEINIKAKESITATIETLRRTELMLNNAIEKATSKFIKIERERMFIHFNFFKELNPSEEYLYETIKKMGFNYEQCKQIVESVTGQSGKVFLSSNHRIIIDRENLVIEPKIQNNKSSVYEINKKLEALYTGTYKYQFNILKSPVNFKIPTKHDEVALDLDRLKFPLKIRKWEKGDRFYPLGMNKPKKISNFLIDNKVSISEKDHVYVLVSGADIAWLIGHRPDERFKVTKRTKNVYLCKSLKVITP